MSEMSGGVGWWQASDGLWYPPETHPDAAYRAQFGAPTAAPVTGGAGAYSARLTVAPDNKVANWRALAHVFMAIPHFIVMYLLGIVSQVIGLLSWFAVLFTANLPQGFHNFQSMYLRYANRTVGFVLLLTEEYPPFEFDTTADDRSGHSIRSDYDYVPGPRNRVTTFFRIFMVIPHYIILLFVYIGAYFVYIIAWFAVLFTGRMPQGMRGFLIGAGRWTNRIQAYFWLLTDEYPPFSLD